MFFRATAFTGSQTEQRTVQYDLSNRRRKATSTTVNGGAKPLSTSTFLKSNASGRFRDFCAHFSKECVESLVVSTNPTALGSYYCPTNRCPRGRVRTTLAKGAPNACSGLEATGLALGSRQRGSQRIARRGGFGMYSAMVSATVPVLECCPEPAPLHPHRRFAVIFPITQGGGGGPTKAPAA